jgi:hypothetical protein
VTLNERQDYFGQTVNIASRVQRRKKQLYLWRVDQYCDFRESGSILYGYSSAPPQWLAASAMQGFSFRVGWFRGAEIV